MIIRINCTMMKLLRNHMRIEIDHYKTFLLQNPEGQRTV